MAAYTYVPAAAGTSAKRADDAGGLWAPVAAWRIVEHHYAGDAWNVPPSSFTAEPVFVAGGWLVDAPAPRRDR